MDEVDMLKKLDHPNIVEYFETYDDKHYLYLVMELCPGGELFDNHEQYLKNNKPYSEKQAAEVIFKCLEALSHCHAMGITHRDIKPENIMFGKDGEVRLVDFGLAKDSIFKMRTYAGTPYFMAPEVLNGSYTHKCDIWSLACVLYLLVAGKLPYSGLSREEVFKKIRKGKFQQLDTFSPELKSLLSQMFQLDPENRPTAHEL
jgi:calcium-dependent protein kinase